MSVFRLVFRFFAAIVCCFSMQAFASDFTVHDNGRGHAVLILSGGPGFTAWNLLPLQQHIAKQHRALLFDMRGMGDQADFSLPEASLLLQWIEDIEQIRKAKQINKWTLVGHSWGGLMALLYARAHPGVVDKIVLLNPVDPEKRGLAEIVERINERQQAFSVQDGEAKLTDRKAIHESFEKTEESVRLYQIQQVLPTYFVDMHEGVRYAAQFSANDFSPEINNRIWQEYDQMRFTKDDARLIRQPIVFAACDQDLLMPENMKGLNDFFPNMNTHVFQQCAHFPWVEQPKLFYPWLMKQLVKR